MLPASEIDNGIAEAYRAAALANADMRSTTEALESIRVALGGSASPYKAWDNLNDQIGRAEPEHLRPALIAVRRVFEQEIRGRLLGRLHQMLSGNPQSGWVEWIKSYAEALVAWRGSMVTALAEESLPFSASDLPTVEKIRVWTRLFCHERWGELYGLFSYFAEQESLPAEQRAKFLVSAGRVQLYHLEQREKARANFERARELAPNEHNPIGGGLGSYWLQRRDFEKAQACFQQVISMAPLLSDGYIFMGEACELQAKLDAAEDWYQKGLRANGVSPADCSALLRLYGRPQLFARNKDKIAPLFDRAIAIDADSEYPVSLDVGYCYQQNKEFTEARGWYQKAVDLDARRLQAYTSFGYLYIDEGDYDQARASFLKAVEVAPEALDGYWGAAMLAERRGREEPDVERRPAHWREALHWYEECLPRRPEWNSPIRAGMGEIRRKLGLHQEAEAELLDALRQEPSSDRLLGALHDLADDAYKNRNDASAALRIYHAIREIKEPPDEADFRNRVGNLWYYQSDYAAAAESYRGAIAAEPNNAVYFSNLALACENLNVPGHRLQELNEAISALMQALVLKPQEPDYASRLEYLKQQMALVTTYGEAGLSRKPGVSPITVLLAPDLLPHILVPGKDELSAEILELISALRTRIQEKCGVRIPGINFRDDTDPSRAPGTYFVGLRDVWIASGIAPPGKRFFAGHFEELAALHLDGTEVSDSPVGMHGYWIDEGDWARAESGGLHLWGVMEFPMRHLEVLLRNNLAEFVTHQEVTRLLNAGGDGAPREIQNLPGGLTDLTLVMRALVSEGVPVVACEVICKTFVEHRASVDHLAQLVEILRSRPEIRPHLPGQDAAYSFYRLAPSLEDELTRSIYRESPQPLLALEAEKCQAVLTAIRAATGTDQVSLLVKDSELRPLFRTLVEVEFPNVPVLACSELLPELQSRVVGEVGLPASQAAQ